MNLPIPLAAALAALFVVAAPAVASEPVASFTYSPTAPAVGQSVQFESTSMPTDGLLTTWDLDDDGAFDDAEGKRAKRSFEAGAHVVRMRVRNTAGQTSDAEQTVQVGPAQTTPTPTPSETATPTPTATPNANQPPVAKIATSCQVGGLCEGLIAREGTPHTFDASPSKDPDGTIVRYDWDVDGKPGYEQTTPGPALIHTLERHQLVDTMKRTVNLRVTDDQGATSETTLTITLLEPRCEQTVVLGRIRATGACLRHYKSKYVSQNPVTVNGITLTPKANRTITLKERTIASNGASATVTAKGAPATLVNGAFSWGLSDAGQLTGLKPGGTLNALKITDLRGQLNNDGSSRLSLRVQLPAQFGSPTSDDPIVVTPGKAGASASEPLEFRVANASIGPIGLKELAVSFDGEDLWEIRASVKLPPPIPYTIEGDAGIRDGQFEHAGAAIDFGTPGIGPFGPMFLHRIAFRVEVKPKKSKCVPKYGVETLHQRELLHDITGKWFDVPDLHFDWGIPTFALCGEVGLSAGPKVLGVTAIGLDAGLGLATYDDRPAVFRAYGKVRLVEIPLADASLEVHTNGYTRMHAGFDWGIDGLATLKGFLQFEMLAPKFNAEAHVDACLEFIDWCAGARALVSSKGVAVCLKIDVFFDDWTPGFGYRWGEAIPTLYFSGCDVGEYKEHINSGGAGPKVTASQASTHDVEFPADLPGATIVATGKDAPPKLTLIGPKGERITSPDDNTPVTQQPFFVMKDPRAKVTQFAIAKPSAGHWKVVVESGEVVSLKSAEGLERPQVSASVERKGGKYTLRTQVDEDINVTFVERGGSTGGKLAEHGRGTKRTTFTPAAGAGETRKIVALVEGRGEYEVASYRAPAVRRPGKVKGLTANRKRVSWRDGGEHEVRVAFKDGRSTIHRTAKHALKLHNARSVKVRKLADSLAGPFASRRIR
jgi:hypothetical protein